MAKNVLFIGCGKVATGAARLLHNQGITVQGVRRDTSNLPDFIEKTTADISQPSSLSFLKNACADTLIYSLAAGAFNEESYTASYLSGLRATIAAANFATVKRLIFVSSTAVYHQNDGSEVTEESATSPTRFNGKIMLQAEHTALNTGVGTCLRLSGIYGPGRNRLIDRVRNGQCTPEDSTAYTNRIHSQDCSGVLAHLIMQPSLPPIVLGTDSAPARSSEVESYIAEQLKIEKQYATPRQKVKRIAGSKRCCNRLLLDMGFKFAYPDYIEGYKKIIKDSYGDSV